jgi:predicted GNAT family acetyltransferase
VNAVFEYEENCIYLKDDEGKTMGRIEFPAISENVVNIQRTLVDPAFRGKGVAGQLTKELAEWLRTNKKQAVLTCSYAVGWFPEHPEYDDVVCKTQ